MPFCKACGQEIGDAVFCPKCGANQGTSGPMSAAGPSSEGLDENVAGLLCYVLGWVTGIIFLLVDKRPFVKFHAAQSIVVFGALTVLRIASVMLVGFSGILGWGLWALLFWLIGIVAVVLWILLMIKAYQHEMFKLPIAAEIAQNIAGK